MDAPTSEAVVMIPQLGYAKVVANAPSRTLVGAEDRARSVQPRPVADRSDSTPIARTQGDSVVVGGFGLDLAYARQVTRIDRQGQSRVLSEKHERLSLEFDFATRALPRDASGEVNLEALANSEERRGLAAALEALADTGLKDPGALAKFVQSVDALFSEYERDLGLNAGELEDARRGFVDEVKSFFARVEDIELVPPPAGLRPDGFESLGAALEGLRARVQERRQDVLMAAGDLSKVLAERSVSARDSGEGRAVESLGRLLDALQDATAKRSTRELRDSARQRLLTPDGAQPERVAPRAPDAAAQARGRGFLDTLARLA
jgi:hypothetical protein